MYPGTRNHKTSKHMVQTEEGKEHETYVKSGKVNSVVK